MIFITFFGNCLAISLLAASLGTKYWITAQCKRLENAEKSDGNVNMGLFEYEANLNYGAGERNYQDKMLGPEGIMYHERSLMVYELYIATISTVVAAIVFGIISAMLAIVNTGSNPVEAICHIPGLYLWNGLALFSSVSAFITWIVQFYVKLQYNVLTREYRDKGKWTSEGRASFGFSFALVVIASGLFIFNLIIIFFATRDPYKSRKTKLISSVPGKQAGDTMLY